MSLYEGPALKRQRTYSSYAEEPLSRSSLWFEDGSVVLQAESTQFRVHRTVLARHSVVFHDMFLVPQPPDEPTVEGCAVVHLADSAEDVYHVLAALYDKNYNIRDSLPYPAVAAMLRLGLKYQFDHLRDEAVARLTSEFPNNLEAWELLPSEYTHIKAQKGILFDIINLALQFSIRSILPVAYYLCLDDIETLFSGEKREDNTVAQVPPAVLSACVLGRDKIITAMATHTLGWLNDTDISQECKGKDKCSEDRATLTRMIWKPLPEYTRGLEKWTDELSLYGSLCRPCTDEAKRIHAAGREKMWELLPTFFGLPDWQELKNFD
ncbi:hypothetical protein BDQ12DRAFT_735184 [Crucibulum laeve]|uniref:BTB domain-containing protein n=1 Tax=Crucibulum laeve TaxID=68775 RepID=A0A5C3M0M3_9AGAR|nr:hypothetical protein BDQ12DRAFT_735184 [Crucibulum laeve]